MSNPTDIVLAVDGGASRTRAWIVRLDGTVVSRGVAGGANVFAQGIDVARRVIVEAALAAWHAAGFPGEKPCAFLAVSAGIAGAGATEDQRALSTALAAEFGVNPGNTTVDHDLRIALAGALVGRPGVVVVAGTGSAAFGRDAAGHAARSGGWGAILDDGGSGYWIGLQAMRLIVRVADGRCASTPLTDLVMAQQKVASPRELLNRLQPSHPACLQRPEIASLAPRVFAAADGGDTSAGDILDHGARELVGMAAAVLRRLGLSSPPLPVTAAGGLLENHDRYFDLVAKALQREVPGAGLERPRLPPVAGAALLALELAGSPPSAGVVERLAAPTLDPVA